MKISLIYLPHCSFVGGEGGGQQNTQSKTNSPPSSWRAVTVTETPFRLPYCHPRPAWPSPCPAPKSGSQE